MNNDLISREALKKALHNFFDGKVINEPAYILRDVFCHIDSAPAIDITEEQAIDKLHETGWLPMHDKEMTERPQGEWNYIQAGMCVCPFCGATPHKLYKNYCAKCGAELKGGVE